MDRKELRFSGYVFDFVCFCAGCCYLFAGGLLWDVGCLGKMDKNLVFSITERFLKNEENCSFLVNDFFDVGCCYCVGNILFFAKMVMQDK